MARRAATLGGAGGIGRALVARLEEEGWEVVVLDLPASLRRHPPPANVAAISVDLASAASVDAAFEQVAGRAGTLDGFVNLAGFASPPAPLAETDPATFDEVLGVNLRGAFLAARRVLPLMADGGSLVHVASGLAANVRPGFGPYAAAKAGLLALTRTLALEAAPAIRVNAVAPGAVDTAFLRGGTGRSGETAPPPIDTAAYARAMPLGRLAEPVDVVGPIRFLLSDESRYMTGQTLWVNGGAYMP